MRTARRKVDRKRGNRSDHEIAGSAAVEAHSAARPKRKASRPASSGAPLLVPEPRKVSPVPRTGKRGSTGARSPSPPLQDDAVFTISQASPHSHCLGRGSDCAIG